VDSTAGRTPVEPPLPLLSSTPSALSLPGLWARATAPSPVVAPSRLGQLGRKCARARARAGWT
jgi:hypothetical protein